MPDFTENAIKKAFMKLLNERSYSNITVKSIVTECGINRNTFYYHFQGIPELLEQIIKEQCDMIISRYPALNSIEECLKMAADFARENRMALLHVYQSVDRAIFETHLWRICDYGVRNYIDTVYPANGKDNAVREAVFRFYKCACFGHICDWLEGGMQEEIEETFHAICELRESEIQTLISSESLRQ